MTTTFVRAARHRSEGPWDHRVHITGDVLHLAVWAFDEPGTALLYGTGRFVPLCGGGGRPIEVWRATGPGYGHWATHAHWPVCRVCQHVLDRLADVATQQAAARTLTREEVPA
jgi:hypothetical protein